MKYSEAKAKFIQAWGILGSQWGINKTMAQIHALLLIAPEALSADEIMEELNISRGNANMNIRALIDWGIVEKQHKLGERREYFTAEKDLWNVARQVTSERRKREVTPIIKVLEEVENINKNEKGTEVQEFKKMTKELKQFAVKTDNAIGKMIRADKHWFWGSLMKLFR